MDRKETILLLNDTEDDYHFGCTATCRAIKANLGCLFPGLGIKSIGVQEIWRARNPPKTEEDFFSDAFRGNYCRENAALVEQLMEGGDDIFVNGEGTIFGFENRPGTQNLLYLISVAQSYGKRVSLINHSCFPYPSPCGEERYRRIYTHVYSRLHRCVVRDSRSLANINELGIRQVELGFDCSPLYVEKGFVERKTSLVPGSYILLGGGIDLAPQFEGFLAQPTNPLRYGGKINRQSKDWPV